MRGLVVMMSLLVGCSTGSVQSATVEPSAITSAPIRSTPIETAPIERESMRLPLTLYLVLEGSGDGDGSLSTVRTADELAEIGAAINEVWAQAGLLFEPVEVRTVTLPADVLRTIVSTGDTEPFFSQLGRSFDVPDPGIVNGFYVSAAFGVNGFNPLGSRVFFVVDEPTVHDERVSSHEIGHILGLRHELDDPDRLMFSGTNGMTLTPQEQEVARYGAQGMLDDRS